MYKGVSGGTWSPGATRVRLVTTGEWSEEEVREVVLVVPLIKATL